jgi:hypothetical protein
MAKLPHALPALCGAVGVVQARPLGFERQELHYVRPAQFWRQRRQNLDVANLSANLIMQSSGRFGDLNP